VEHESLQHAAEALEQGRTEDAVAFLREAVRDARERNDGGALAAARDLARAVPGGAADELLAELEGEADVPAPAPPEKRRQLGRLVFLLLALAIFAGSQLVPRILGSEIPDAAYEGERPAATRALTANGVYLVPLGGLDTVDAADLAEYIRRTYSLRVEVLPRLPLRRWAFDEARDQLDADALMRILFLEYRSTGKQQLVIGLTDYDMHLRANPDYRFVFSSRGLRHGYSVVSSARMGPGIVDRILLRDPTETRARKMVERQIGFVLFGLPPTLDETSPMRAEILSTGDIDEIEQPLEYVPGKP
jgi:predicted Zn-dependent protease